MPFQRSLAQKTHGQARTRASMPLKKELGVFGDGSQAADDATIETLLGENLFERIDVSLLDNGEHALLAFRQHELERREVGLSRRNFFQIERHGDASLGSHLRGRREQSCRAHVLQRLQQIAFRRFHASFEKSLLGEGVADLNLRLGRLFARSFASVCHLSVRCGFLRGFLRLSLESLRCHRRAVDSVSARFRAQIDDKVAFALRARRAELFGRRDAYGHGVDENVVVVVLVEVALSAQRRDACAIAVEGDSFDNAFEQRFRLGVCGFSESERVQIGDGSCSHGENIAHDASHACRRAFVRGDHAGVVVAFHLEDERMRSALGVLADAHGTRVLAFLDKRSVARFRKLFEEVA